MQEQPDTEEDGRDTDSDKDQRDHDAAAFPQFHEPRCDHRARWEPRPAVVWCGPALSPGRDGDGSRRHRIPSSAHCGSPSRLVTWRNQDSREAWSTWSRYTAIPLATSTRLISAITSCPVPAGRITFSPVGSTVTCVPSAVPI